MGRGRLVLLRSSLRDGKSDIKMGWLCSLAVLLEESEKLEDMLFVVVAGTVRM